MAQKFSNNAVSTLAGGISNVDTTLSVQPSHGSRFPVVVAPDIAYVTLEDASGNLEIVKVTGHASGAVAMTVERAQQGTAARAWASGDLVELRPTAAEAGTWEAAAGEVATAKGAAASLAAAVVRYAAGLIGDLQANGKRILGLPTPVADDEPATKAFAQSLAMSAALPAFVGQAGRLVRTDGTLVSWGDAWGPATALAAPTTLVARRTYHVDTRAGSFAANLPASYAADDWILLRDVWRKCGDNPLTLAHNGGTVEGSVQDYEMNLNGEAVLLVVDATRGWVRA